MIPTNWGVQIAESLFKHALENLLDYRWILKLTVAHR
ncbi:MAG: DUF6783 domain-containing protein [Ruminococcus sp.]